MKCRRTNARRGGVNRYLPLISGVVIRVKRHKSEEVAVPVSDGADLLAQPQGIHFRVTGSLQVADVLPLVTRVAVQRVPVQLAQSPQGRHHLTPTASMNGYIGRALPSYMKAIGFGPFMYPVSIRSMRNPEPSNSSRIGRFR